MPHPLAVQEKPTDVNEASGIGRCPIHPERGWSGEVQPDEDEIDTPLETEAKDEGAARVAPLTVSEPINMAQLSPGSGLGAFRQQPFLREGGAMGSFGGASATAAALGSMTIPESLPRDSIASCVTISSLWQPGARVGHPASGIPPPGSPLQNTKLHFTRVDSSVASTAGDDASIRGSLPMRRAGSGNISDNAGGLVEETWGGGSSRAKRHSVASYSPSLPHPGVGGGPAAVSTPSSAYGGTGEIPSPVAGRGKERRKSSLLKRLTTWGTGASHKKAISPEDNPSFSTGVGKKQEMGSFMVS